MSKEPRKSEEAIRGNGKIIIYIAVTAIALIVIISYILIANMIGTKRQAQRLAQIEKEEKQNEENLVSQLQDNNQNDSESVSTPMGKTVEESNEQNEKQDQSNATNSTQNNNSSSTSNKSNSGKTENNSSENKTTNNAQETSTENNENSSQNEEKKEVTFCMPVDGDIVKGYAKDNLVYSETLQEWIVHQAIDIKANSRDVVKAAADGTVTSIKNDPRYGLTVIIEHDGGFKTVYSNLLTAEFVVEGEKVKQGQTLGTVGSSAVFEIADEPHLHFEILKDSVYIDPTIYLK